MKKIIAMLLVCLLLTGCWDRIQLKSLLFVDVVGIDTKGDDKQLNVSYVISSLRNAQQGGGTSSNLFIQSSGINLYDATAKTNKAIPGILSVLETRLYLIGTQFAKDEPLKHLNIVGQFTTNPLYAYLAMYDGDLSQLLAKKKINDQTVSDFLVSLLDNEKQKGRIPSNKLLYYLLGGSKFINDFALNRFEPFGNGARLAGTALFKEGKYTGVNLNEDDTQLLHLMDGAAGNGQLIIGKYGTSYSVLIQDAKRKFHIHHTNGKLNEIEISLEFRLELVEDGLEVKKHTNQMLTELEKDIAADLTLSATSVIETLQKTNCDMLQLGHRVAAYHPKLYKGLNWRETYPKVSIKPNVKIEILNSGILD
ncbi:Ger(x)C family spore germination protein [Cohnella yongneupensis]|uniref:Ger(X)C family spore germination protein n=1 Tax=Cohnella yongneupensis TaxID=425006 RepID=A0ABW0R3E1_9BACL